MQESEERIELHLSVTFGDANFSASGDGELVLRAFAEFKEHVAAPQGITAPRQPTDTTEAHMAYDGACIVVQQRESAAPSGEPLPVFLNSRSLKGNAELAVGIAAWAKHYKGQSEIDTDLMQNLWRISGHKIPANIPRDVRAASKEGWLEQLSNRKYAITVYGEKFVDGKIKVEE